MRVNHRRCVHNWLLLMCLLFVVYLLWRLGEPRVFRIPMSSGNRTTSRDGGRIPKMIAWTPVFEAQLEDRMSMDNCAYKCEVHGRTELPEEEADAIVFHFRDLYEGMPLPSTRWPDQIYVSYLLEAPAHAGDAVDSMFARHFFNATVDYRFNTLAYTHTYRPLLARAVSGEEKRAVKPLSEAAFDGIFAAKSAAVLVLISNCNAASGRMAYIEELSKHIAVTKVGKCYGWFGRRVSDEEEEALIKSHSFVISFENILCKDYVTEKFWRLLKNIVPIVLSRRFLDGFAPDSAFVAADDYSTPKEMAAHLQRAIESRNEYKKYFAWRNTHFSVEMNGFCNLCRDLHFGNVSAVADLNMKQYYSVSRECEIGTTSQLLSKI